MSARKSIVPATFGADELIRDVQRLGFDNATAVSALEGDADSLQSVYEKLLSDTSRFKPCAAPSVCWQQYLSLARLPAPHQNSLPASAKAAAMCIAVVLRTGLCVLLAEFGCTS